MPKIENQNQNPQSTQAHEYSHFVGVKFLNTPRAYFFGVKDDEQYAVAMADLEKVGEALCQK